jgi:ssDNA-binding Zn-finger/Zn-ribbon topoisomerase 1
MTRQKRKFYGCVNYPNCDFTSWQKPLPGLCPTCNGLLVANRNQARCTLCGWQGAPAAALNVELRIAGTAPPKREDRGEGEPKKASKPRGKTAKGKRRTSAGAA